MNKPLALQLYSIRREMAADPESTLKKVPGLGYQAIETAGTYGWSVEQWKRLLGETGLKLISAHLGLQLLEPEWGPITLFQKTLGNSRLVVPALPKDLQSAEGFATAAKRLNALGKKAKADGFTVHYHNHAFEFAPLDGGKCGIEILMAETEPGLVSFQVDTYWVEKGGKDAKAFCEKHSQRISMIHAKELRKADGADVPAGQGNVDFKSILPLAAKNNWPVIVEFEGENAIESVKQSAKYLASI